MPGSEGWELTGHHCTVRKCPCSVKSAEISIWSYLPVFDLSPHGHGCWHVAAKCGNLAFMLVSRLITLVIRCRFLGQTLCIAKSSMKLNCYFWQSQLSPEIRRFELISVQVISANRHIQIISSPDHSVMGFGLSRSAQIFRIWGEWIFRAEVQTEWHDFVKNQDQTKSFTVHKIQIEKTLET